MVATGTVFVVCVRFFCMWSRATRTNKAIRATTFIKQGKGTRIEFRGAASVRHNRVPKTYPIALEWVIGTLRTGGDVFLFGKITSMHDIFLDIHLIKACGTKRGRRGGCHHHVMHKCYRNTLASLQCRHGGRRIFTDQTGIDCTKSEAP